MTDGDMEKRSAMTTTDALALAPGDRIRLRPQTTWATNPPGRTLYTVANAAQRAPDFRAGCSEVHILSVEGFGSPCGRSRRWKGSGDRDVV